MAKKKDEKDVLVVRDEKTGEISVVAGLNADGSPKRIPAKAENAQSFLQFDRHGDVLDNFFRNFFRQCREPSRFGFYRVAADQADKLLEVIKDLLKDPDGNKEMLAPHKVDTSGYEKKVQEEQSAEKQEQPEQKQDDEPKKQEEMEQKNEQNQESPQQTQGNRGYQPIDESKINWQKLEEKWGVKRDDLEKSGDLNRMLNYGKSDLVRVSPNFGGEAFELDARLYFKKDGESLGINIKMLLSGDGYPVDIALSPDGKQIVMSVMYMKNGALKNKVAFYDFSEIGKNVNNRFIAAFEEEFDDKMVGRIRYLNDQTVCAFSDKGLTFISVKNVIPDTNVTFVPVDEEIQSICYSDKYAAVVVDSTSGSPYRLDVYNTDGKKVTSIDFDYAYTGALIDGDRLILYNEESCRVYNLDGHEKFNGQFDYSVSLVRAGKNRTNSLITAGSEVMKEINLR